MTTTEPPENVRSYTYEATLYGPLFYASEEGNVIRTDPTIAATALTHALGYEYYGLEKRYLLRGEETVDPSYGHLGDLPFLVSEMVPVRRGIEADERTFRTVSYGTERTVVSSDTSVGEYLTGAKSPVPRGIEGSNAGWHKVREYVGLSPDINDDRPTFTFTVWTPPSTAPPETLGFRVGIKRTGELRATRQSDPANSVALNQFLLESAYGLDEERMSELLRRADGFDRGTDVRTARFYGLERAWVQDEIVPEALAE